MNTKIILLILTLVLSSIASEDNSVNTRSLQNIGTIDYLYFIGQENQQIFFISQQSKIYGYLDASTGQILQTKNIQNYRFVRISKSTNSVDFISDALNLQTLSIEDKKTQVHSLANIDSSLKQNIKSFAKINNDIYLLINDQQVLHINSNGEVNSIKKISNPTERIVSLVPFKEKKQNELYVISFDKKQGQAQNLLTAYQISHGNEVNKFQHLIINNEVKKVYLNKNSVTIEGDKLNYIFLGGFNSVRRFEDKIVQYFNQQFILDEFKLFRPSVTTRHDFIVAEPADKSIYFRSLVSLIKNGIFYDINFKFVSKRNIERESTNEVKQSWYSYNEQKKTIYLVVQRKDNTVKFYSINHENPYKVGQVVEQSWQIKGNSPDLKLSKPSKQDENESQSSSDQSFEQEL